MIRQLEDLALRLPELRAFTDDIAAGLVAGRHALIRTCGTEIGLPLFRRALDEALDRRRGPSLSAIQLSEQRAGEGPDELLGRVSGEPARRFGALTAPESPVVQEIFWLEGAPGTASAVSGWDQYLRALGRRTAPTDFVVAWALPAASTEGPVAAGDATWLRVARWAPRASSLELRLLARLGSDGDPAPVTLWREAVLPELAGPHPELVSQLWDVVFGPESAVRQALEAHGLALGLEAVMVRRQVEEAQRTRSSGTAWVGLIAQGAAQDTLEHGPEPTAAALAVYGDVEGLRHRLWRGTATLLLPWLASLRRHLCRRLVRQHGARWALLHAARHLDEDDRARFERDPLAAEFPAIHTALRATRAPGEVLDIVREARSLRNEIAHGQPVTFARFDALHRKLPLIST